MEGTIDHSTDSSARVSRRRFVALGAATGSGLAAAVAVPLAVATGEASELAEVSASSPANAHAVDRVTTLSQCSVCWSVPDAGPRVAFTFDDGPDPEFTPGVLDALERAGVQATFFMMGHNVDRHPQLARAVVAAGHEVGNHTWTHLDLADQDHDTTAEQLRRGTDVIERVTGVRPRWFRPPRGNLTGAAVLEAARLGQQVMLWSTTPGTAADGGPADVVRHVAATLAPGGIVDLHDGLGRGTFNPGRAFTETLRRRRHVEIAALPRMLDAIADRGLEAVTLGTLVAAGAGEARSA